MNLYGIFMALGINLPGSWPFFSGPVLLYLGPETIMPLASILAAVVGVLLVGWRYVLGFFKRIFGGSVGKGGNGAVSDAETENEVDQ